MKSPRKTMANAKTYNIYNEARDTKIRLDLNENAWGCSPKVLQAIRHASVSNISLYPAYDSLINKLAQFYQVGQDNVIISNGADDSIRCVFDCFVEA